MVYLHARLFLAPRGKYLCMETSLPALASLNSVDILCSMFGVGLVGFTTLKINVRTQVGLGSGRGR